jgi:hypothetical protein
MKTESEFYGTETKLFLYGNWTKFFSGTDAETEFPFPANIRFLFEVDVHGLIQQTHYITF